MCLTIYCICIFNVHSTLVLPDWLPDAFLWLIPANQEWRLCRLFISVFYRQFIFFMRRRSVSCMWADGRVLSIDERSTQTLMLKHSIGFSPASFSWKDVKTWSPSSVFKLTQCVWDGDSRWANTRSSDLSLHASSALIRTLIGGVYLINVLFSDKTTNHWEFR